MAYINEEACELAGIDAEKLQKLANQLERAGKVADELGVTIFGHSGSGQVIVTAAQEYWQGERQHFDLASILSGQWDGGDPDYINVDEIEVE